MNYEYVMNINYNSNCNYSAARELLISKNLVPITVAIG